MHVDFEVNVMHVGFDMDVNVGDDLDVDIDDNDDVNFETSIQGRIFK